MKYLIDGSAWLAYAAGSSDKLKRIIDEEEIGTTAMAVAQAADAFHHNNWDPQVFLRFIKAKAELVNQSFRSAADGASIAAQKRAHQHKFLLVDGVHLALARDKGIRLVTANHDLAAETDVVFIK